MNVRPGRILSVSIVLAWAGLLGTHLVRSYSDGRLPFTASARSLDLSATAPDAELSQRGVYFQGVRIGHIRERVTPLESGYRAEQSGELTLTLLGRERRVSLEGTAETGSTGELRSFTFRLRTESRRSPFETVVSGKVGSGQLALSIRSGGSERTETRRLEEPIVLPLNLYHSLASRELIPGASYRFRLFDPMTLSEGDAVVTVRELEVVHWGGREEEAYRLSTTFAGLGTTAWVNDRGEVLREETPLGWTLLKEAPGSSIQARGPAEGAPDPLALSAVPAIGFAGDSAGLSAATLELRGFPDGFPAIDGGRQRQEGSRVTILREELPYSGSESLGEEEKRLSLRSDAFIQAEDPEILDWARRIAGSGTDVEKARALNQWVYEQIAKSPTLSLPSAKEILKQRVGDCNEHTVLFAALARAAGIPTRIATGLAYVGGQFYYHAWPEVFLGRWLAIDPTLGQFPADPLHLRLLTGGIETQYEVLKLLGRGATIEVLETR